MRLTIENGFQSRVVYNRVNTVCVLKATKAYCYEMFEIMEKFYSSKTLLKMAGGGMHLQYIPHPPLDPPLIVNLTKDGLKF